MENLTALRWCSADHAAREAVLVKEPSFSLRPSFSSPDIDSMSETGSGMWTLWRECFWILDSVKFRCESKQAVAMWGGGIRSDRRGRLRRFRGSRRARSVLLSANKHVRAGADRTGLFRQRWLRSGLSLCAVGVLLSLGGTGCSRTHYRLQADCEVSDVVSHATANPRFDIPDFTIAIDPRSRLFDPTDPDHPPMPPDDPDSNRLMVCVDGHKGFPRWHEDGDLNDVEINNYAQYLPYNADGRVRVDLRGALEIARLNSRDYQAQLETLYLSAIDVTAERFAFDVQYYGGNITQYAGQGKLLGASSEISTTTNPYITKMNAAGGTLVAGLANSIVWQFAGGQTTTNTSIFNFAISQPLLQFAGRAYNLEKLTRVERALLANVRQYQRYRQGFYLSLATGGAGSNSLSRIGGLLGGSGLSAFSGVGTGGFGTIGNISTLSGLGGGSTGAISPGGLGGLFGLLQQQQNIRNIRNQNSRLRDTWLQLSAAFDAGRLENRFQVDFARQQYYSGQSILLSNLTSYDNQLDNFKLTLFGLPPNVPLEIADPFFSDFNLLDPDLGQLQDEVGDRLEALSAARIEGTKVGPDDVIKDFSRRIRRFIEGAEMDLVALRKALPVRKQVLREIAEFPEAKENQFDNRALAPEDLQRVFDLMVQELPRIKQELIELSEKTERLAQEKDLDEVEMIRADKELLTQISLSLLELSLMQARIRLHKITIQPIKVTPDTALQVALSQRPDWMNAKAQLIDSWRLIRYNANRLRTNLTLNASGNVGTTENNPVAFNVNNTSVQAGVTLDPPLTRLLERNQYRQSLIDYQQQRRALMANRDAIHRDIRVTLRNLRLDQYNLELRRLAVDVAITQVDVARLKLSGPEKPSADMKEPVASPTLARDLVDALNILVSSQQTLFNTWGDYEGQRRGLDFILGTMHLDESGMWMDPGTMTDEKLIARYYELCPNPLDFNPDGLPPSPEGLAPADLPPEPSDMGLTPLIELPSPSK